jgi:hypothetical protein
MTQEIARARAALDAAFRAYDEAKEFSAPILPYKARLNGARHDLWLAMRNASQSGD